MRGGTINQSVLSPAGVQAWSIYHLWQLMLWVAVAVFALVLVALGVALVRGLRRQSSVHPVLSSDRYLRRGVGAAVAGTTVILLVLLAASVWTERTVESAQSSSELSVAITGHQWWWEVQYEDAIPARRVLTANELHVPVGRPVVLKVTSRDVIHSFWVPSLQGKRDLIPGYTTAIWLQADYPGVFRGQCAEFCGLQHAHMALEVVAEPDADFEAWLSAMRKTAPRPTDADRRHGQDVFMRARCAVCHTIQGTEAAGQVAPDLTHVASRRLLGAGTVANTPEAMAAWIRDSHTVKPGNQMPPNPLQPDEIAALVQYLETLR
jgi:cytochrome c oxidase subunit 2